jgi:hypothetical protein
MAGDSRPYRLDFFTYTLQPASDFGASEGLEVLNSYAIQMDRRGCTKVCVSAVLRQ